MIDRLAKAEKPKLEGRKLHVELGCNAGHVTIEWADRSQSTAKSSGQAPDVFVGVDWKYKMIFKAAEKAMKIAGQICIYTNDRITIEEL